MKATATGAPISSFPHFPISSWLPVTYPNAIVATGFHRNTLINEEGGTDKEQFRVESVVDRVSTTGTAWLGLTVGCAQCHTHKFDPITQKEFYQLFAFFNNQDEPALSRPTPEQAARQVEVKKRLSEAQARLAAVEKDPAGRQQEWERQALDQESAEWTVLDPLTFRSAGTARMTKLGDGSLLVGGDITDDDVYTVAADLPAGGTTAIRLEVLTHESLPRRGPGFANGNFILTEFEAEAAGKALPFGRAIADHSQANYPIAFAIDKDPKTGWAINVAAGEGTMNTDRTAVFILKQPLTGTARVTFRLRQEHPNRRYQVGRFRLSAASEPPGRFSFLVPAAVREVLKRPAEQRSAEQKAQVEAAFKKTDPVRTQLSEEVTALQEQQKELDKNVVSTLVLKELDKPRATHVHLRGDFLRKGDPVEPGVPAVLPPLPATKNPTRLDLARWLVDPKNPLTARVTVNRVWQQYFGTGLVETENDFGTQGTSPSHPELLDYLAARFSASPNEGLGWSLKQLHRLIVTSATYRQSSRYRPELQEVDPQNRLLARQHRLRLEAEIVRDVGLASSGLLCRKIGGPSVYPPQPTGLDLFTQNKKNWTVSEGEDRYRRGMYTFIWRSSPYAMFTAFDAPNAQLACTRRVRSNTPLQALMLANDQGFIEMAKALAVRIMREASSEEDRVRRGFRLCVARQPSALEVRRLCDYYRSQAAAFERQPDQAKAVAPGSCPEGVSPAEAAAWTAVARVMLNLDEFITRE